MITAHAASRLVRHKIGGESYPPPTTLWAGVLIGAASSTTDGVEPSGGGYIRVAVPNIPGNWPDAVNGSKTHAIEIRFPRATANWGNAVQIGFWDSPTGGRLLAFGTLPTPRSIGTGMAMVLSPETVTFGYDAATTLSIALRNELLDHLFGGTASAIVSTLYFGYTTTASNPTAPGTEPSVGSYARVAASATRVNFPETDPGRLINNSAITWPKATAAQGTTASIAVFDAATSGNYLCYAVPTTPLVVSENTIPEIGAGEFFLNFNGLT